jgi:hypothetical protein
MADMDGHLRRVRTGYEVRGAKQIEKLIMRHPTTAAHNLVFHHGYVRSGTAEGNRSQLEKQQRQLSQRCLASLLGRTKGSVVSAVSHSVAVYL